MTPSILIVEDEHALAAALATACRRLGFETRLCSSGEQALAEAARSPASLVVLDIGLPDMSGLRVLEKLRERQASVPVVIITAHGNLENAVAAKRLGAAGYLVKPLDLVELQQSVRETLHAAEEPPPAPPVPLSGLVGASPGMQRCFVEIANACASDAPVLISGPTGSGKTLTARVIHENSARKRSPFVTLHCGALPEPLLESELFGHEKNAFTGAGAAKPGHVERAHGGTLFLDEIADVSPGVQAKLLRVVEEKLLTRLGGREDVRVNLRLITATNRNLREEVRAGRFREDLFYRLHVLEIALPPLAERKGDLSALAGFLLASLGGSRSLQLSPAALAALERHSWPGNIRELRNVLERAAAVAGGPLILPQHLPPELRTQAAAPQSGDLERALEGWLEQKVNSGASYREMHDELEALMLRHLLERFEGKPTVLARELKMNRVTLRRRRRAMDQE